MPGLSLLPTVVGGWLTYATVIEPRWFDLAEIELRLPRWPAALDGLTILQLSDFHARRPGPVEAWCASLAERLPTPDLLCLTGDFAEYQAALEACRAAIQPLGATLGKFAVFGNNDYQPRAKHLALRSLLDELEVRPLDDEAVILERAGAPFAVGGLQFYFVRRIEQRFVYPVAKAFEQVPAGLPRLLLSHTPEALPEAALANVDLVLAGHTHGGQVCWPGGIPIHQNMSRPSTNYCDRGLHRRGGTWSYTSRGLGASTVPLRFWSRPEAVWLTLRSGSDTAQS